MSAIIFALLSLALILVSGYLILIVLMQRASSNSGMGSALGGGAAESALGAGAGNVLTKGTIFGSVAFFILSFVLYLGFLGQAENTGPKINLPDEAEVTAPGSEPSATTKDPLLSLPEGMDAPNAQSNQITVTTEGEAGQSQVIETPQGTMIVTEDAIQVNEAEQPAEEATPAESAPVAEESTETPAPAETNAQ